MKKLFSAILLFVSILTTFSVNVLAAAGGGEKAEEAGSSLASFELLIVGTSVAFILYFIYLMITD